MKNIKTPNIVSVLILTLLTALVWVLFSVYRAFTQEPAPSVPAEIREPLTPTLDQDVMEKIQGKIFLDESQIPELQLEATTPIIIEETPVTVPESETPVASPEAEIVAEEGGV